MAAEINLLLAMIFFKFMIRPKPSFVERKSHAFLGMLSDKYILIPITCAVALVIECVLTSSQKHMWMDEILTFYPASIHKFSDLQSFTDDKINVGSYFFFYSIWVWCKAFSNSAVSLRVFSSLGFCLSILINWFSLKKSYGSWSSSLSIIIVYLNCRVILFQNSEARFYGMFFCLISILYKITISNSDRNSISKWTALWLFVINGLLPLTHFFGFIYDILFLCAIIGFDYRRKQVRLLYYLCSIGGWILFIPFIPSFKKTLELSKPHFWILKPSFDNFVMLFSNDIQLYIILIVVILILGILGLLSFRSYGHPSYIPKNDLLPLIICFMLLALPLLVWTYSQFFQSLFVSRYMIGFYLGLLILTSACMSRLYNTVTLINKKEITLTLLILVLLGSALKLKTTYNQPDIGETDYFSWNVPIITDNPHVFYPEAFIIHCLVHTILSWIGKWQSNLVILRTPLKTIK